MSPAQDEPLHGSLVDEHTLLSVTELSRICAVEERYIIAFVEEGVLLPADARTSVWHFRGDALPRARRALRLQRDLEINLAGVALAMDLMDEIDRLRRELQMRHS